MLSFFFPPNFSPLPFPKLCLDTQKVFFSLFISKPGKRRWSRGEQGVCRSSPTFPSGWKTSPPEPGGFPGSLLFRIAPCHCFGYAKPCLGTLLSQRDTAPALSLAMKRLLKAAVPCPRPHTVPLHTSSRLSLEASLLPGWIRKSDAYS